MGNMTYVRVAALLSMNIVFRFGTRGIPSRTLGQCDESFAATRRGGNGDMY